jgi:hypothetical protein
MFEKERPTRTGVLLIAVVAVLAVLLLAFYSNVPTRGRSGASQPKVAWAIPAAIETYSPPTTTPDLRPTPTYEPPPTQEPPPQAEVFPVDKAAPIPNVAWSAESDNRLTIWVGHYSDNPSPGISAARRVAQWNNTKRVDYAITYLALGNMAVSPNSRYLAALIKGICEAPPPEPTATPGGPPPDFIPPIVDGPCEGIDFQYIYVFDLATGRIQTIPDYDRYHDSNLSGLDKIIGWFDDDRFGIKPDSGHMLVATRDGAPIETRVWPGASIYDGIYRLSLLPDHKTIFAWVHGEFFFRDAPTGVVRHAGKKLEGIGYQYLTPSPDGKFISYLMPRNGAEGSNDPTHGLWVQNLASDAINPIVEQGVWDSQPSWSPDSTQIAFVHADMTPITDNYYWIGDPTQANTNIYVGNIANFTSRQLTSFTGAHNAGIQWTPAGNLLLSSTANSQDGRFDLVAVSSVDGKATTVMGSGQGEGLFDVTFFGTGTLPGMPRSGSEADQTKPSP